MKDIRHKSEPPQQVASALQYFFRSAFKKAVVSGEYANLSPFAVKVLKATCCQPTIDTAWGKGFWRRDVLSGKWEHGQSLVSIASEKNTLDSLLPYISREQLLKSHSKAGFNALHYAAHNGYLHQLLPILKPEDLLTQDKAGFTPLDVSLRNMQFHTIKEKLNPGLLLTKLDKPCLGCSTVLAMLCESQSDNAEEVLNQCIDLDIPDSAQKITGEDWWARHLEVITSKGTLQTPLTNTSLEMF